MPIQAEKRRVGRICFRYKCYEHFRNKQGLPLGDLRISSVHKFIHDLKTIWMSQKLFKCLFCSNLECKNSERNIYIYIIKKPFFWNFWKLGLVYFCIVKVFFFIFKVRVGRLWTNKQLFLSYKMGSQINLTKHLSWCLCKHDIMRVSFTGFGDCCHILSTNIPR